MSSKWTSRKFWTSIAGEAVGIVTLIWGAGVGEQVSVIAGAAILVMVTLGYLHAEGQIDAQRVKQEGGPYHGDRIR